MTDHLSGSASPLERSLWWFRRHGYVATIDNVTERRLPFARKTLKDFCGFADAIVFSPVAGIIAVQATTAEHAGERLRKIRGEPRTKAWLESRGRIVVMGWALRGAIGRRKTYRLLGVEVTLMDERPFPPESGAT